jgi:hypothetical protein
LEQETTYYKNYDVSVQANNTSIQKVDVHKVDCFYSTIFIVSTKITTLLANDKDENLAPFRITF